MDGLVVPEVLDFVLLLDLLKQGSRRHVSPNFSRLEATPWLLRAESTLLLVYVALYSLHYASCSSNVFSRI
jgi:hypothetical protein